MLLLDVREHGYEELTPSTHSHPYQIIFLGVLESFVEGLWISTGDGDQVGTDLTLCEFLDHFHKVLLRKVFPDVHIHRRCIGETTGNGILRPGLQGFEDVPVLMVNR